MEDAVGMSVFFVFCDSDFARQSGHGLPDVLWGHVGWTVGSRPTQSKLFSPDSQDIDCPAYRGVMCDWGWTMGSRPIRIVGC